MSDLRRKSSLTRTAFKEYTKNPLVVLGGAGLIGLIAIMLRQIVRKRKTMASSGQGSIWEGNKMTRHLKSKRSYNYLIVNVYNEEGKFLYRGNVIRVAGKTCYVALSLLSDKNNDDGMFEFWDKDKVHEMLSSTRTMPTIFAESSTRKENNFRLPLAVRTMPIKGIRDQIHIKGWDGNVQRLTIKKNNFWIIDGYKSFITDQLHYLDHKNRRRIAKIEK